MRNASSLRLLALGLLCLVLSVLVFPSPAETSGSDTPPSEKPHLSAEEWRKKGDKAVDDKEFSKATEHYSEAIALEPGNYLNLFKRALALRMRGKLWNAINDLSKVLDLKPNHALSLIRRAQLFTKLGLPDRSMKDLDAFQLHTKEKENKEYQAELKITRKLSSLLSSFDSIKSSSDFQWQINLLSEAIEIASNSISLMLSRAELRIKQNDLEGAAHDASSALKINQRDLDAIWLRGYVALLSGDTKTAQSFFKQGIKIDPENKKIISEMKRLRNYEKTIASGDKNLEQKHYKAAIENFRSAVDLFPSALQTASLQEKICKAHFQNKEAKQALDACNQALNLNNDLLDALLTRSEIYESLEEWDSVIMDLQHAERISPAEQRGTIQQRLQNANKQKKMAARKDYYKILGISKSADKKEIRKAYRELASIWHPDKVKNDPEKELVAEKKYQELTEAYEILKDDEKRAKYDRGEDLNEHQGSPFQQGSPFTFHFGGGGGGFPGGFNFQFH